MSEQVREALEKQYIRWAEEGPDDSEFCGWLAPLLEKAARAAWYTGFQKRDVQQAMSVFVAVLTEGET